MEALNIVVDLAHVAPQAVREVLANIAGIDHFGLGSDFDGATATPTDTSGLAEITQALLNDEFTPAEIQQVMGGNVMRLLSAVLSGN